MLPEAVVVDCDGTLVDVSGIRHLLTGPGRFDAFHRASIDCPPHQWVVDAANIAARAMRHAYTTAARLTRRGPGDDEAPGYETDNDEGPAPKSGAHGTCCALVGRGAEGTATCGYEITLRAERTVPMADGTDGHGHPGGRETLVWRHTDPAIDHMHTAQLGGPA